MTAPADIPSEDVGSSQPDVVGTTDPPRVVEIALLLDGEPTILAATPTTSLLRALRDAGHTATTGACEQGECGSCSVELDGRVECSCLVPALICSGSTVRTVRSLLRDDLGAALAAHGAVQCGFCTPGIVVAAEAALAAGTPLDEHTAREALAGNLCRCTGYLGIIDAVLSVDAQRRSGHGDGTGR